MFIIKYLINIVTLKQEVVLYTFYPLCMSIVCTPWNNIVELDIDIWKYNNYAIKPIFTGQLNLTNLVWTIIFHINIIMDLAKYLNFLEKIVIPGCGSRMSHDKTFFWRGQDYQSRHYCHKILSDCTCTIESNIAWGTQTMQKIYTH